MSAMLESSVSPRGIPPPQNQHAPVPATCHLPPDLTLGEERVLPYLCAGWSDVEISLELEVSAKHVRASIQGCLHKFGATSRAQLAARLLRGEFGP